MPVPQSVARLTGIKYWTGAALHPRLAYPRQNRGQFAAIDPQPIQPFVRSEGTAESRRLSGPRRAAVLAGMAMTEERTLRCDR